MKTLTESSIDHHLANQQNLDAALDFAERFTELLHGCATLEAPAREARVLEFQFPAILLAPEAGDAFAGRIRYGLVGLSPEPCGLGYYCVSGRLREWLSRGEGEPQVRSRVERLLARWQGRTTAEKVRAAYPKHIAEALPSDAWTEESGVSFPLYRMAGTVLDYGKLLRLGVGGLEGELDGLADSALARATRSALATLRRSIAHYRALATDAEMAAALDGIANAAPRGFREAVQLFWLYALHSGTWNYGRLDTVLGPFLARDLDDGRLTREQALELICSLWRLMHAYSNQYNNRVIVGGRGRADEAAADRFALLAIEATRRLRLNQPQLTLRFHRGQNTEIWERAVEAIGEGCTYPLLYNDDINIPSVSVAFSVPERVATGYTPYGCGEYTLGPGGQGSPNGVINLLKALEVALHAGRDPLNGRLVAEGVPAPEAILGFDELWEAYARVVDGQIRALAEQQAIEYRVMDEEAPLLFISALTPDCLARGRGAFGGGSLYLGGTLETYGNTNAADSLHVIEELVFKRREIGLAELVRAMDADFKGHEELRARCRGILKYGNDEALSDAMAVRVHRHVCTVTRDQAARVGLHSYLVVIINNWANTVLGWKTGASADGRKAGEPMANANNPAPGADISGPTAFLNSLVRLDPALHAGAVQNMKFSREWFRGSSLAKFKGLLAAYFAKGGAQAMITVVSRADLESALREPEKWGHLLVRVGGFSIRFVDLPREGQLEVLGRTLH